MRPNLERFKKDILALAQIGRIPAGGVSRFSLTPEDLQGRKLVIGLMKEIGLSVIVDAFGNIRGRREGTDPSAPIVMMGSHIDSVPNGGDYDGPTGVMGALEVMRALNDDGVKTRHPVEAVVFTDEEGVRFKKGLFGSGGLAGTWSWEEMRGVKDPDGVTFQDALKAIERTGTPEQSVLKKEQVKAFVELHVEQSAKLDDAKLPIGIVDAISGSTHLRVTVHGKADHAGATPMNRRVDALVPVALMVQEIERIARSDPRSSLVGTVGIVTVEPGAMNIVPSRVMFTVDIRDTVPATLDSAIAETKAMIDRVARERGVKYEMEDLEHTPAVQMSPTVRSAIARACDKLGLSHMDVSSRAIHDTSNMALVTDSGMIFVPSVGGKSHSPDELTHWQDIQPGLDVLYKVIRFLAGG